MAHRSIDEGGHVNTVVWLFGAGAALMVVAVVVVVSARHSRNQQRGEAPAASFEEAPTSALSPSSNATASPTEPARTVASKSAEVHPAATDSDKEGESTSSEIEIEAEGQSEEDANEVLTPAADPLSAFDLDGAIRQMRREYWASRWMFGEDACADLRFALGRARALAAPCLADVTVVEGKAELPTGCTRMNAAVLALKEPATPLRTLRANKYAHALAAYRTDEPATVNPHRASVRAGRYVSPDPTYGLARLASEIKEGLAVARLEVAKVSPTAGSEVSARMRAGLAHAQKLVSESVQALSALQNPSATDLLQIEAELLQAVWIRRAIDLTGKYLPAKEWARVAGNDEEWTRLAILSTRLAEVLIDLRGNVEVENLKKLAGCLVLLEAGPQNERPILPARTCEQITKTCEQIALIVSEV
ncbi:hypothetical protein [Gleimia europaea]|uniref:hypothetical protein n=1 Tax=Gleimia europaea TaxID=66228 RepID=UPI0003AB2E58|nr:hypothetical protein [Gleimia europaea]